MNQTNSPQAPQPSDEIHQWEKYFRHVVESKSVCKVRTSHLQQTAREREQVYLKQLLENAQTLFPKSSLSSEGNRLQKQALELIKLRRRVAPDGSTVHQEAGVFLAIVKIHQGVQSLLHQIDALLNLHSRLETEMNDVLGIIHQFRRGKHKDSGAIFAVIQRIRSSAADATIQTSDWLRLSFNMASYEIAESAADQQALGCALQSSFLAAQILGKQRNDQEASHDQSAQPHRFDIQFESFLIACLLKDVGIWLQRRTGISASACVHHSEVSAGLLARVSELPVGLVRLVREHHECLDGSGLPCGIRGPEQHFESRLLAVITRWNELYNQQLEMNTISTSFGNADSLIETASDLLLKETSQNRWEKLSTNLLLETLGVRPMQKIAQPQFQRNAKPNWRIPRPHFLDSIRRATPATSVRK